MAPYNFEGDINGINDRQLEFINKVILEQDLEDSKVTFEQVGKAGDNYAATVKRIIIEGKNGTMQMIAKIAPSNEILRMTMNSFLLFRNEHVMYTEVLPKLLQLQKDADVPEEGQLRFAKCYGSLSEQPNEVILLEDLKTSDFVMLDRFEPLSDECVKSVLRNFGILHSLSYVLKKKEPETYDHFKANLINMWAALAEIKHALLHFKQLESNALMILEDPEHKNALKNKVADLASLSVKLAKYEDGNKYSIIQQGDSWTNNIMFRFEEGTLKESIMIDYQLSKNSNPVCDLLYMIFNCTDHETRSKHFYDWLDYYHQELDKSLSNFDMKANLVYPRDQLDADMRRYGKLTFGLSVLLAGVLTMKSEEASKMQDAMENGNISEVADTMNVSTLDTETIKRFRNRIVGLIESYNQFGLL